MTNSSQAIGLNLKELRRSLSPSLSAEDLSARIGRASGFITKLENGYHASVSVDTVVALCAALGCSPSDLDPRLSDAPGLSQRLFNADARLAAIASIAQMGCPVSEQVDYEVIVWPNGEVVDVDSIEGFAEDARTVATSPLEDGVIRTPDWVMDELANVSRHAARMVLVIHQAEAFKRRAATVLERARAEARVKYSGLPAPQQTARIVLAVLDEKRAYDDAVVAFEYARRIGNLLSDYTGRVQSIGKQIELTCGAPVGSRRGPF